MTLIRKDAIKRAEIVDAEMGWESGTAIGKMALIWDAAQEDIGRNVVRRRQLLAWAHVRPDQADRFLAACCIVRKAEDDDHVHFLERRGEDRYYIVGNREEFERIEQHRAEKSAAGKRSAEVRRARFGSADPRANREQREQTPEQESEHSHEHSHEQTPEQNVNPSALALASELESAKERLPAPSSPPARRPRKPPSDGAKLWEPYRQAYEARFKHEPVPNAKTRSQLKTLAERLGVENAEATLRFYFGLDEDWLARRAYPLGILVAEAESWRTKMVTRQGRPDPFGGRDLGRELRERGHD